MTMKRELNTLKEGIPHYTVCPLFLYKLITTFPATICQRNLYRLYLDSKLLFQMACYSFLPDSISCIHFLHFQFYNIGKQPCSNRKYCPKLLIKMISCLFAHHFIFKIALLVAKCLNSLITK